MAFIRDRSEERTGFQNGLPASDIVDFQNDFAMVYRMDASTAERIKGYRERGYVVHLMTGISWGHYLDYLDGDFDGETHWDEAQTDRNGNQILHSPKVPYMVPTVSFADYITAQLKQAVDLGVEAIHVEEPEFWDRAGYSEAFKREFFAYYKTPWSPPHESVDARYKCAKLKAYLYTRTIERVSAALKEYSIKKYGKAVRFYVPTHSLLNYTQWKIVSPEGRLADIPCVDGCIAQVWTGTAREKNWYQGVYAERTFETAYLEYGVMQELVKGTGRKMWFLHDPIEDNPRFDWDDYRENYFCTVAASLLHPKINTYEICPWPDRIFREKYPRNFPDGLPIPDVYKTLLNNTFQTLGTVENAEQTGLRVGILMADAQLYQREYPDSEFSGPIEQKTGTVLVTGDEEIEAFRTGLVEKGGENRELMLKFMSDAAFPAFYGLAMPLVKYGIPVRPVLLDNARRYAGYLDDYDVLIMSYEYMKPDYPDMNAAIARWVMQGGTLIYVGDGFDPFHNVRSWWTGKYPTAAEHLFEMLGVSPEKEQEIFTCLKGTAAVWKTSPAKLSFSKENADLWRAFFGAVLDKAGREYAFTNRLTMRRGKHLIAAVMDESVSDEPLTVKGVYADLFAPDFAVVTEKTLRPGEKALLFDLTRADETEIVGSSVRVNAMEQTENGLKLKVSGAADFTAYLRLRVGQPVASATVDGEAVAFENDPVGKTVCLRFESKVGERCAFICF
ncbi:MAG: hypothetical protein IJJ85_04415 [Clostridia bacterium]|nr:hypothetical protein [Clostridia bacterium]